MDSKFVTYNKKCRFFHFRFRKDKDQKYIDFLESVPNQAEFLRNAIDRELDDRKTNDMNGGI